MPAPTNDSSSSVLTLRAASARSSAYTSCSECPASRSSPRASRSACGMSANRSSIERTPIASSISRRSASVTAVYSVKRRLVGGGVHQRLGLSRVRQADLDQPALAVGVVVDLLGAVGKRLVDLDDLTRQR